MPGTREDMINAMTAILGLGENPPGSNHNYVTQWYGMGDVPWCDETITYAAYHSGCEKSVCFGSKYAYTVAHAQAFQAHGQWHSDVAGIQRGDIVFFDWAYSNNISAIDHVGIVTDVKGSDIYTIEGNSDNVCARRVRQANVIVGYGRPAYVSVTPTPTPTPTPVPVPKPSVSLAHLINAAKTDPKAVQGHLGPNWPEVKIVEVALNKEGLLAAKWVDGSFGSMSVNGYSLWQNRCGYSGSPSQPDSDANGIPGRDTLTRLGNKYGFTVVA